MSILVTIFDAVTFIVLTFMSISCLKKLLHSQRLIYFVLLLFYVLYVLPVGIDVFITYPSYNTWKQFEGFYVSYNDVMTRIIYDTWLLFTFYVMKRYRRVVIGNRRSNKLKYLVTDNNVGNSLIVNRNLRRLLLLIAIAPVLAVVIFKIPTGILYIPLWLDNNIFSFSGTRLEPIYYYLQKLSYISIVAAFLYMVNIEEKKKLQKLSMLILIYMLTCVEAKRAIYAVVVVMFISYFLYNTNRQKKYLVMIGSTVILMGLLLFTTEYMVQHRVYAIDYTPINTYTQIKMDFFRDDRVKFVIYKHLQLENVIDFPFQSYITQICSLFPLEFIFYRYITGYNKFFTASLLGVEVGAVSGWVTTSFFDEIIANLGILGMIIGPMIIMGICNYTDECSTRMKTISIVGITLLFMLNLSYIMWYLEFWVIVLYLDRRYIKRRAKIQS